MPPKPLRKPTRKEALALPQNARFAFLSEVSQFLSSEGYLHDAAYFGSQALKVADTQGASVLRRNALQHCEICGVFLSPSSCARIECVDLSSRTQRRTAAASAAPAGPGGTSGSKGPNNVVAVVRSCKVCGHRNSQPLSSAHGARQLAESEARLLEDLVKLKTQPQQAQEATEQQQQEGGQPIVEEVLHEREQQQAMSDATQQGLTLYTTAIRAVEQLLSDGPIADLTANTVTVGVSLPEGAESQEAGTSFAPQAGMTEVAANTAAKGVEGGLAAQKTGATSMHVAAVVAKDLEGCVFASDKQMWEELIAPPSKLTSLSLQSFEAGADGGPTANQVRNAAVVYKLSAEAQAVGILGSGAQEAANVERAVVVGILKPDGQEDAEHDPDVTRPVVFEAPVPESGSVPNGPERDVWQPDDAQYADDSDVMQAAAADAAAEGGLSSEVDLGTSSVQAVTAAVPANTDEVSTDQAAVDMPGQQLERQASVKGTLGAHGNAVRDDAWSYDAVIATAGQAGGSGDPVAGADRPANKASDAIVKHTACEYTGSQHRDDPNFDTGHVMEAATGEPSAGDDPGVRLQGTLGIPPATPANADAAALRATDAAASAVNVVLSIDAVASLENEAAGLLHIVFMEQECPDAVSQSPAPDDIQLSKLKAAEPGLGEASIAEEDWMTRSLTEAGNGGSDERSAVAITGAGLGMPAYDREGMDVEGSKNAVKRHKEVHSGDDKEDSEVVGLESYDMSNLAEPSKHQEGAAVGDSLPPDCIASSGTALDDPSNTLNDHSSADGSEESDEDDEAAGTEEESAEKPAASPDVVDFCDGDDDDDESSGRERSVQENAVVADVDEMDSSDGQAQRKPPPLLHQQQEQQSALEGRKETLGIGVDAAAVLTRGGAHVTDDEEIAAGVEVAILQEMAVGATEVVDITSDGESDDGEEDEDEEKEIEVEAAKVHVSPDMPGEEEDESEEAWGMLSEEEGSEADERNSSDSDEEEEEAAEEKQDTAGQRTGVTPTLSKAAVTQSLNQKPPTQHKPLPPVQQPVTAKNAAVASAAAAKADFAAALVALEATVVPCSVKRRWMQPHEFEPQLAAQAQAQVIQPVLSKFQIQDLPREEDKRSRVQQQLQRQGRQATSVVEREVVVVPASASGAAMERPERGARVLSESGTDGKCAALLSEAPGQALRTCGHQSQPQQQPRVQPVRSKQTHTRTHAKPNWLPEGYVSETSIHPLLPQEREDGVLVYEAPYAPGLFDLRPVVELEWPRVLHHPRHRRRFLRDRALYAAHHARFAVDQPQPQPQPQAAAVSLGPPMAVNATSAAVARGERHGHQEQNESGRGGRDGVAAVAKAAAGRGDRVRDVHVGSRSPKTGPVKPVVKDKLRRRLELRAQQRANRDEKKDDSSEEDEYEASGSDQDSESELRHLPRLGPWAKLAPLRGSRGSGYRISSEIKNEKEEEDDDQEKVTRRQGARRVGTDAKEASPQKGPRGPRASAVPAPKQAASPAVKSLIPGSMDREQPQPHLLEPQLKGPPTQSPLPQKKRRVHWAVTDGSQQQPEHQPRKEGSELKRRRT